MKQEFQLLLSGLDTVQCAYYLLPEGKGQIDFELLGFEREGIRASKRKDPAHVKLGNQEFLLKGSGSGSGYPFVMTNSEFRIEFGEFNNPSFFVTFSSQALWSETVSCLHVELLDWARSVGWQPFKEESLSRVDFCFDYHLPESVWEITQWKDIGQPSWMPTTGLSRFTSCDFDSEDQEVSDGTIQIESPQRAKTRPDLGTAPLPESAAQAVPRD